MTMPHLSKIPLNPLRRGSQRLVANPHRMHAAVLGGIGVQPVSERVLWRVDEAPHRHDLLVLTQSRPSWQHLVEQAGWPGADGSDAVVRDISPVLDLLAPGRQFSFRVRANPVSSLRRPERPTAAQERALARPDRRRGVRVGHRTASHQLGWFTDRASPDRHPWGFVLRQPESETTGSARLVERRRERFSKAPGGSPVTIDTATFEGVLTVVDAERFRDVLLGGLGGAKAYGCGLLTVAPAFGGR
ncbi:MAG: type I-E CRISPR-associated protein Cas6/Cse3/CasE [Dermatophilaceae bacterium]